MSIIRKKPNILNRNKNKEVTEDIEKVENVQDQSSSIPQGKRLNFKCHVCSQKFRTRTDMRCHFKRSHDPKAPDFHTEKSLQNMNGSVIVG